MTAGVGHNRPPKPRDPRDVKLEMIQKIMTSWGYSASEALVMIGIITQSNDDFEARLSADQIMTYLKTKRKPSIWPVLRSLEKDHGVLVRNTVKGSRRNEYCVLPQRVIESVIEHYEERNGRRVPASKPAPTKYVERTKSEGKPSTENVPSQEQPGTENVPVRSAYRYAQRTRSGAQPSTPSVPSQDQPSTPSVPGNNEKPNDSTRAGADAGARAATPPTTNRDSETPSTVGEDKPRVGAQALPEIDGLNGNTAAFCEALAKAENQFAPDYEMAHTLIQSNVNHYGAEIVSVGFLQWQTALADRSSKAMKNPFRSLPNYIEQVRKDREKSKPRQALKDKGFSTFSDLIEKSGGL